MGWVGGVEGLRGAREAGREALQEEVQGGPRRVGVDGVDRVVVASPSEALPRREVAVAPDDPTLECLGGERGGFPGQSRPSVARVDDAAEFRGGALERRDVPPRELIQDVRERLVGKTLERAPRRAPEPGPAREPGERG
jgi:hypothetical protein